MLTGESEETVQLLSTIDKEHKDFRALYPNVVSEEGSAYIIGSLHQPPSSTHIRGFADILLVLYTEPLLTAVQRRDAIQVYVITFTRVNREQQNTRGR